VPLLGRGKGAGSPSNTMWPGPRSTSVPSGILIHPTIWPHYTNVTDRQTGQDRQQSDSLGRTVLQTVAQKSLVAQGQKVVESSYMLEHKVMLGRHCAKV